MRHHMKVYWRVYCHKTFGGFEWLCFLIAVGDVTPVLISIVNDVINERCQQQTGHSALPAATREDARLSVRAAAERRGEPVPSVLGPTQRTSEAKRAREHAKGLERRKRRALVAEQHAVAKQRLCRHAGCRRAAGAKPLLQRRA